MRIRALVLFGVAVGVGFAIGFTPTAEATRNSSGTYSLPAGNPVVSGTAISSTVHNATMSDIATELTNSLDRGGRGAMTAPLQLASGTVALPGLTFSGDTDSGLYRVSANDVAISAAATKSQEWTSSGTTIPGTLAVTGVTTLTGGVPSLSVSGNLTVDTTTLAVDATNNAVGIGDATPDSTLDVESSAAAAGLVSVTNTSASGFSSMNFFNNSGSLQGGIGYGNGSASQYAGKLFINTGSDLSIGVAGSVGVTVNPTNPSSSTAFTNTITSKNIVKAWALVSTNGSGACTISAGFNVTGCSISGNQITVTMASAMSSASFGVVCTGPLAAALGGPSTTTTFVYSQSGINPGTTATSGSCFVLGAQ